MIDNKKALRSILVAGASVAAITATPSAFAQEGALDTIIVSTQKREENQQEVPVSVETLPGERLSEILAGGADVLALSGRVPGLYAESSNGRLAPRFYIRGLGNVDFDLAASQPVSLVVDDVVLENVLLKSSPLFDIEQVEVSRGPQGTLFGRNTPAGVIKFVTRKPGDELEANASVSYGTYDTVNAEFGVGMPLIPDILSVRVSGLYQSRSDWIDNAATGEDDVFGDYEELAGRFQLLFTPTEDLSVLANFHGRNHDGTAAIFRANILEQGTGDLTSNFDRDTVFFDGSTDNAQEADGWGFSGKVDYDFGDFVLTSITSYEDATSSSIGDVDGGIIDGTSFFDPMMPPAPPFTVGTIRFPSETRDSLDLEQFTQEVRLASDTGGPLKWQVGFFYFDTEFDVTTEGPGFPPFTVVRHKNDSWAFFGQASYDLTDDLTVTGGVRYTEDNRTLEAPTPPPFVTVNPTRVSDEDVSWDVSALYKLNDSMNVYARVARGFRGPTIQGRDISFAAFSGAVDPQTIANSETIMSYEAGFKSQWFDNRARLNATAFYYEVDDQQFSIIGGLTNSNQVINADQGRAFGFEVDAEALVTDNLFVSLGFGYADTEIQDEDLVTAVCGSGLCTPLDPINGLGQASIDGNPFPNAPKYTLNAFVEYTYPFEDKGEFFVNTDWYVTGDTNIFLYEAAEFSHNGQFEGAARAGFRDASGRYEFALFARNITDEVNIVGAIDFNNLTGFVNEPRIFGAQLNFKY